MSLIEKLFLLLVRENHSACPIYLWLSCCYYRKVSRERGLKYLLRQNSHLINALSHRNSSRPIGVLYLYLMCAIPWYGIKNSWYTTGECQNHNPIPTKGVDLSFLLLPSIFPYEL